MYSTAMPYLAAPQQRIQHHCVHQNVQEVASHFRDIRRVRNAPFSTPCYRDDRGMQQFMYVSIYSISHSNYCTMCMHFPSFMLLSSSSSVGSYALHSHTTCICDMCQVIYTWSKVNCCLAIILVHLHILSSVKYSICM